MLRTTVALLLIGLGSGDIAKFTQCDNKTDICAVQQLRITPCGNPARCGISKSGTTHLSVDFTSKFPAQKLDVQIYKIYGFGWQWKVKREYLDVKTACSGCPAGVEQIQTVEYNLYPNLTKELPSGQHQIRVKMRDVAQKNNVCCFNTNVKVMRT